MELQTAKEIIDTLAQGIHPCTGEAMPSDSPYNAPPVIRALFAVSQALEAHDVVKKDSRDKKRTALLPPKTGKPWTPEDDDQIKRDFAAGMPVKDIAVSAGRTRWAIEARLVKLGVLTLGGAAAVRSN